MSVSLNFLARSGKLDLKICSLAVTISHRLWQILLPNLSHRFWRNTLEGEHSVVDPEIFWVVWKFLRPLVVVDQLSIKTREPYAQRCEQGGEAPEVVCIVSNVLDQVSGQDHGEVFWHDERGDRDALVLAPTDAVEVAPPQI